MLVGTIFFKSISQGGYICIPDISKLDPLKDVPSWIYKNSKYIEQFGNNLGLSTQTINLQTDGTLRLLGADQLQTQAKFKKWQVTPTKIKDGACLEFLFKKKI